MDSGGAATGGPMADHVLEALYAHHRKLEAVFRFFDKDNRYRGAGGFADSMAGAWGCWAAGRGAGGPLGWLNG